MMIKEMIGVCGLPPFERFRKAHENCDKTLPSFFNGQ